MNANDQTLIQKNSTVVLKFGGASVATPEHFKSVAQIVLHRKKSYKKVVVVVSAMGNTTDQLIQLAQQVHPSPPRRELDMLLTNGERVSVSLLAMALDLVGDHALSFTGSQSGIITTADHNDAKIIDVRPIRLGPILEEGKTVIVAGFQGVSENGKEITTLGRGGSDTSAVALGIALNAEKVEFFKDVAGIFDSDPKKNPDAKLFHHLNYDEAFELVNKGAKVLHARCVKLAQKNNLPLHVVSFLGDELDKKTGTWIGPEQRVECPKHFEV